MRQVHALFAAVLAATVVSSCWQPAFDPELSASSLASSKMKLVSTITVTDMQQYRAVSGIFLPRRVAAPTDGIWLHGGSLAPFEFESTSPWYMRTAFSYELFSIWSQGFSAAPQGLPIARLSPHADALTPLEALVVATKPPSWGAAWLYETNTPESPAIALSNDSPVLPFSTTLLAAGFATVSATNDSMLMVYRDETAGEWKAGEISLPLSPPFAFSTQPIAMPTDIEAPTSLSIGFAARKGSSWYVSLTQKNGAIRTFRWTDNLSTVPVELTAIKAPLVAVLNAAPGGTPTLLTSNGMSMTAYDEDGTELYSFPVGSLRFVHERYDATTTPPRWMAVFCRTIFIRNENNDNGTLRVEVFEIPVEDLPTL